MKRCKLRTAGILISILFIISCSLTIKGYLILRQVRNDITEGINRVTSVLTSEKETARQSQTLTTVRSRYNIDVSGMPIAMLTFISQDNSQVGVFSGITDDVLRMGAGYDTASATPLTPGNCVLYAHRDSGFSPLQTITTGDRISLETPYGTGYYVITDVDILEPDDPMIYRHCQNSQLTLVTCYPFYYTGPAPKRCVVRASSTVMIN